jgi:hypothetical protein
MDKKDSLKALCLGGPCFLNERFYRSIHSFQHMYGNTRRFSTIPSISIILGDAPAVAFLSSSRRPIQPLLVYTFLL